MQIDGTINRIRQIEDAIRQTGQYTEGLLTDRKQHPEQGESESIAFTKTYELYIDAPLHERSLDANLEDIFRWLDSRAVVFKFWYDYRIQRGKMRVSDEGLHLAVDTFDCIAYAVNGQLPERPPAKKRWYERILAAIPLGKGV